MAGRKPKDHVRITIKLDASVTRDAMAVKAEGETFTGMVENALRHVVTIRKRAARRACAKPGTSGSQIPPA